MKKTLLSFILLVAGTFLVKGSSRIMIHPSGRFVTIKMGQDEYNRWISPSTSYSDETTRKALIKEIYQEFNDDFDFIFLILNEDNLPANFPFYGQNSIVKNEVSGTGISQFDNSAEFGSAGRLKSTMLLSTRSAIYFGPSLHELCHNWANFQIPVASTYDGVNYQDQLSHWGFTGFVGQLGGFDPSTLVENVDGQSNRYRVKSFGYFANGGNSIPYSNFELYMMGLAPANEVADFVAFSGVSSVVNTTVNGTDYVTFTSNTKKTYSAAGLPRIPDYEHSQKNFKVLIAVLSPNDLTSRESEDLDNYIKYFSIPGDDGVPGTYNFWEATKGRATIEEGKLAASLKVTPITEYSDKKPIDVFVQDRQIYIRGFQNRFGAILYSFSGQEVLRGHFDNLGVLDSKALPSGTYILRTFSSAAKQDFKIVLP